MRTALASSFLALTLAACTGEKTPAIPPLPPVALSMLTTVGDSASTIEGIAAVAGRLYVCDWKDGTIYRIDPANPTPTAVGALPTVPGTAVLGITADTLGNLYFAVPDPGIVYRVAAARLGATNFNPKQDATVFATGAAGANALAFDHAGGHLWITGGPTGNLYHVGPDGGPVATAATGFATASTDTTMPVRAYVVNGIAIDSRGVIYTGNTGTGEISVIVIGAGYQPRSISTFVRDDRLIGADGLLMDNEDNLWVDANFRNTLARVGPDGTVTIVASSTPDGSFTDSTMVSAYPQTGAGNALRFPAELARIGDTLYLANLNFPIGANTGQPVKGATVAAVTLP
jgi:sugar lactone lactonase YvrE